MSNHELPTTRAAAKPTLNLDTWAVILALGLAVLVRLSIIKTVPW